MGAAQNLTGPVFVAHCWHVGRILAASGLSSAAARHTGRKADHQLTYNESQKRVSAQLRADSAWDGPSSLRQTGLQSMYTG